MQALKGLEYLVEMLFIKTYSVVFDEYFACIPPSKFSIDPDSGLSLWNFNAFPIRF